MSRPPSLTPSAVRGIRRWHDARLQGGRHIGPAAKRLAQRYGLSVSSIYRIGQGKHYRWVS